MVMDGRAIWVLPLCMPVLWDTTLVHDDWGSVCFDLVWMEIWKTAFRREA